VDFFGFDADFFLDAGAGRFLAAFFFVLLLGAMQSS
jgi:hypothetical protein